MTVTEASSYVVEDIERRMARGLEPDQIARQLDTRPATLGKRLRRAGRPDLARQFEAQSISGRDQSVSKAIQNPGMSSSDSAHWNHLMGIVPVQEQRWMEHAACAVVHPDPESHRKFADQWFASESNTGRPKKNADKESPATREAKRICGGCSVRAECLMFSLVNKESYGVWGTMGVEERSELRRKEPEKYQAPDDGRCKRGHSASHRVPDGRGSTKCLKCSDIAAERYRAGAA